MFENLLIFLFLSVFTECALTTPNFVFILTDDQDLLLDSLNAMRNTRKLLANKGVTFTNFFVNSPVCCPSRSTILTGFYPHNTKVFNNSISGGCSAPFFQQEFENATFPALLKLQNYTTFYAGKYLNQYGARAAGGIKHVPIGYDWWIGLEGNSKYYNYSLSVNDSREFYSDAYLTDKISDYAFDFLNRGAVKSERFLMMLAPPASHAPFTPAERHRNEFPGIKAIRKPPFNITPVDKHWLVEMPPDSLPDDVTVLDNIYGNRLRTLLAVDELVGKLVLKLEELTIINQTYIIFTSDNGFHIGQFTQPWDKRQPYESDVRVPFIIRGPKIKEKSLNNFPVSAVDIAPTILDIAGLRVEMDGRSFKNELFGKIVSPGYVLVEYWGEGNDKSIDPNCPWAGNVDLAECVREAWCKCQDSRNNTYGCVIDLTSEKMVKYCHFVNGFLEIYDLKNDIHELENLSQTMNRTEIQFYEEILKELQSCRGVSCKIRRK